MATVLDKELKRQITIDGADYTVVIDPEGMRLVGKGRRKPEAALRWRELLSGEAALAVALNASLLKKPVRQAAKPVARPSTAAEEESAATQPTARAKSEATLPTARATSAPTAPAAPAKSVVAQPRARGKSAATRPPARAAKRSPKARKR